MRVQLPLLALLVAVGAAVARPASGVEVTQGELLILNVTLTNTGDVPLTDVQPLWDESPIGSNPSASQSPLR